MSAEGPKRPVLYWVICSAPPALDWPRPLGLLHEAGQDVCVILTPTAAAWLDIGQLEEATGHAVRTRPRLPTQQDELPPADALLVAPATFNTINKWAAGISDTLALGLLNELLGVGIPITVAVFCKSTLTTHPAYASNVQRLRTAGATVLEGNESIPTVDGGFSWEPLIAQVIRSSGHGPNG